MGRRTTKKARRRLRTFPVVDEQRRRSNPQSLRKVLFDITKKLFEDDLHKAAKELKEALRTRHGRTLHSSFSAEILYNILSDQTHIRYFHLEGYARQLEIPVSFILLYSRLTANQQDGRPDQNLALLRALHKIGSDAQQKLNDRPDDPNLYEIKDFMRWVEVFKVETRNAEQLDLFPLSEARS